jgi:Fe-S cluster biogenesis protein NfuA/nitrite reductase/ring-hydroxylating ferredoxin subunit
VEAEELLQRIQQLTDELERVSDPNARAVGEQLVAAVIDMHGEGLARMLEEVPAHARRELAADSVVGSLMLIHGLYPESLEERVDAALDSVRPYMESHGGNIELLGIEDGVAQLRLEGSCDGCGASQSTLELTVERALRDAAPDLRGMDVEGAAPLEEITGMPLPMAVVDGGPEKVNGWVDLDGAMEITPGSLSPMSVEGQRIVVANVEGELLAYRDSCVACGSSLASAILVEGVLSCPDCARRFYLPRAGRSLDDERLQLAPVPLLRERGAAKVALSA